MRDNSAPFTGLAEAGVVTILARPKLPAIIAPTPTQDPRPSLRHRDIR